MTLKNPESGIGTCRLLCIGLLLLLQAQARGQSVVATIAAAAGPIAVNPNTNKIYIVSGGVTVLDGATNSTTIISAGSTPLAVAANLATNKIYVANFGNFLKGSDPGSVTVIDGATESTTTVIDPNARGPRALTVNEATNEIYVANQWSRNVTVIDGATNSTTTVTDPNANGLLTYSVALNPVTNKIYVVNNDFLGSNQQGNVTVIDGATKTTSTVTDPNAITPNSVAVNPATNKIYVANIGNGTNRGNITVIDGATNTTTTVTDPAAFAAGIDSRGFSVAVNSVTNKIYVANESGTVQQQNGGVTVIDGATNSITHVTDPNAIGPITVALDPATNKIYVTNEGSFVFSGNNPGSITVIDGATNSATTVIDPNASAPAHLAVDPVTSMVYVANVASGNVTVISEGIFALSLIISGNGSGTVTSNPVGVNCPTSCSGNFAPGTTVTLTAAANPTSNFTGWSGACSGADTCNVTLNATASATATFTLQDFSLAPVSTTLTAQRGGQVTDAIAIAPQNGSFASAIQLSCAVSGPSPMPTCALSAASVTPGANSVTSTLTITAPAAAAMLVPSGHWQLGKPLLAIWLPLMFGITVVGGSKKLRRRYWVLCGLLMLMFFLQTACGGSNSSSGGGTPSPTNYTVTVTGTSGTIQHTTQVTVTVQ